MYEAKANGRQFSLYSNDETCVGCGGCTEECSTHVELRRIVSEISRLLSRTRRPSSGCKIIFGDKIGDLKRWSTSLQTHVPCHFSTSTPLMSAFVTFAPLMFDVYVYVQDVRSPSCNAEKAVTYTELCTSTPQFLQHYPSVGDFIEAFTPSIENIDYI